MTFFRGKYLVCVVGMFDDNYDAVMVRAKDKEEAVKVAAKRPIMGGILRGEDVIVVEASSLVPTSFKFLMVEK